MKIPDTVAPLIVKVYKKKETIGSARRSGRNDDNNYLFVCFFSVLSIFQKWKSIILVTQHIHGEKRYD